MTDTETPTGNTDRHNIRIDRKQWEDVLAKIRRLNRAGYQRPEYLRNGQGYRAKISVTDLVCAAMLTFLGESDEASAERLKLRREDGHADHE